MMRVLMQEFGGLHQPSWLSCIAWRVWSYGFRFRRRDEGIRVDWLGTNGKVWGYFGVLRTLYYCCLDIIDNWMGECVYTAIGSYHSRWTIDFNSLLKIVQPSPAEEKEAEAEDGQC